MSNFDEIGETIIKVEDLFILGNAKKFKKIYEGGK